jgi:hypothetical protein
VILRNIWNQFWALIDSDSVRPFVFLYYIPLLLWGVYAIVWADQIAFLQPILGPWLYTLWVWIPVPGTLSAMIGLALRNGGTANVEITSPLLRRDFLGLCMQASGHASMFLVLLAFEIGTISGAYWGQPVLSAFALFSYVLGTAILSLQCVRKLWRGEQLKRGRLLCQ